MTLPWNDFLATRGAVIEADRIHFPSVSHEAAAHVVALKQLALIRVVGSDASTFLHNLLSNDIRKLAPGGVEWSSLNTPKGRMLASLIVRATDDGFDLFASRDLAPDLQRRLGLYVLRSDVRITLPAESDIVLLGVCGADAASTLTTAKLPAPAPGTAVQDGALHCLALPTGAFIVTIPEAEAEAVWTRLVEAGAAEGGTDVWTLSMIRAGLPLITGATREEFVAQMLNFELIGGVNFHKGCYPGQEIIARTQYLGKIKKRMYRVRIPAEHEPAAGEDVFTPRLGEQSAGKIVNVAPQADGTHEALVVMQAACAEAGEAHIGRPDGPRLTFLDLPYSLAGTA